jgi:hypothetical protein
MNSPLRDAADAYRDLGWEVIPVVDKRPRVPWKCPADPEAVDTLLEDPETTGLAVVLGERSGGLVVRDFDDANAFEQWRRDQPDLAATLPIARTGRAEGGYHVYATMHGAPLVKLPDGELRGNGAIVVLPPSIHPTGSRYEWINAPNGTPMIVTSEQLNGLIGERAHPGSTQADTQQTEAEPKQTEAEPSQTQADSKQTEADPKQTQATQADTSIAYVEYRESIDECILRCLPMGPGQRNHSLFRLAQDLQAFLPKETQKSVLLIIVKQWHMRALPFIRTKELVVSIAEFLIAWNNVKWATGTLWRRITDEARKDSFTLGDEYAALNPTAKILRALARHHRGGAFRLASRKLAQVIGVGCPKTALAQMSVLEAMGHVALIEKGESKPGGKASVWRWLGPLD